MKLRSAALAAATAAVVSAHAHAQQPKPKTIPADVAIAMVQEAVSKCRADGLKITAKVVDASNVEQAFLRDDGASLVTVEVAQMKINTVLMTGRASGAPAAPPPAGNSGRPLMPAIMAFDAGGKVSVGFDFGGAVPIKIGSDLVGVIGVSGAPSADKDAACANAGLAKVADKLK